MRIRNLNDDDVKRLKIIHKKYYEHEFSFDDFMSGFIASCAIESDNNEIICAGGLRPLVESVIITNKDFSVRDRREALYMMLSAAGYTASKLKFNAVHAFVQDDKWMNQLKRAGFKDTKGKSLFLEV